MSLKFRIWSKKYEMFTSDPRWPNNQQTHEEFVLTPAGEVWCLVTTDNENHFRDLNGEYIVQWATGLKDINGKEIYEGDVINCISRTGLYNEDLTGEVQFQDFEYVIVTNNDKWPVASFKVILDLKVIGNILENPKLA